LLALLVTRRTPPLALAMLPPVMRMPDWSTTPPSARICPLAPWLTLLASTSVPPLRASRTLLLVTAESLMVIVPVATSALMRPLLTSVCVPPMLRAAPMVPFWPRTVVPAAKVVVPLPSRSMRLPGPVAPKHDRAVAAEAAVALEAEDAVLVDVDGAVEHQPIRRDALTAAGDAGHVEVAVERDAVQVVAAHWRWPRTNRCHWC
jgi:hypothetical protein